MAFIVEVYLRGEKDTAFLSEAHSRVTHLSTRKAIAKALSKEFNIPFRVVKHGLVTEGDGAPITGALLERVTRHKAHTSKYEELKCPL